jgi:hypothetical protein
MRYKQGKNIMKRIVFKCLKLSIPILLVSCATIPDYSPVVDPASITDRSKYNIDATECAWITDNVDYSDEEAMAALKGAAVGGAAVVGTTTAILATTGMLGPVMAGTAVIAPIVWPLLGIGVLVGAGTNSRKTNAKEQEMRAIVWNSCLKQRGYTVLSDADQN